MSIPRRDAFAALVSLLMGCGSSVTTIVQPVDGGTDAGTSAVDGGAAPDTSMITPTSCLLPLGGMCALGQTCPAGDNCNVCTCAALSEFATCTARPCAADAGAEPDGAVCAGASISRDGRHCSGPDDGDLPLSCCTDWNCDVRLAACDSLPPTCPGGEAATVTGVCYGPCVPATNCAPMRCADGCLTGWSCDPSSGNCRYAR